MFREFFNSLLDKKTEFVNLPGVKTLNYRFSGHDAFHCRYAWLPKAVKLIDGKESKPFAKEDDAMVKLGVGKNMVRSIQFWSTVAGIIVFDDGKTQATRFGKTLLGHDGHDEYLENIQTLWLLHWKIATCPDPLFAWDFLLNQWHRLDFTRREALEALEARSALLGKDLSENTLESHLDIFLHTYFPTKSRKGEVLEDNLDCPLVELRLLKQSADRISKDSNRREPAFAFRVEDKPEISDELFAYCLDEFWTSRFSNSQTLPFREVSVGEGSPGQIFKLPERYVRERLDRINASRNGPFAFDDTASTQRLRRRGAVDTWELLDRIYEYGVE